MICKDCNNPAVYEKGRCKECHAAERRRVSNASNRKRQSRMKEIQRKMDAGELATGK